MAAEFAVALPAVVLVLGVLLGVATAGMAAVRCVDAARAAARAAARHDSGPEVQAAARATAPEGAVVRVEKGGEQVRVTVSAEVDLAVPGLPSLEVRGSAVADLEETAGATDVDPVGQIVLLPVLCLATRRRIRRLGRARRRRPRRRTRHDGSAGARPLRTGPGPVPAPRDRGAGTVLAVGLVAGTLVLAGGSAWAGQVFVARHRAASAADLAALAGAAAGGDCGRAAVVAAANGAGLVSCSATGAGVVDVAVRVRAGGGVAALAVDGGARAGPVAPDVAGEGGAGAGRGGAGSGGRGVWRWWSAGVEMREGAVVVTRRPDRASWSDNQVIECPKGPSVVVGIGSRSRAPTGRGNQWSSAY